MMATTIVGIGVYGENILGYPIYIILASFLLSYGASLLLLDSLKGWRVYPVALVLFLASIFLLPRVLAQIAQEQWVQRRTAQAKEITTLYMPRYVPAGYRLADVERHRDAEGPSFSLHYQIGDRFSPFNTGEAQHTIYISGDKFDEYAPPKICDYSYSYKSRVAEKKFGSCEKVGKTQSCDVYKSSRNTLYDTVYYCKIDSTRFRAVSQQLTEGEMMSLLNSLQKLP